MEHLSALALSFPVVVYTVLLGVALVYWVFVMVGAAHVNLLGDGAVDAAADAALDGVAKGALEGATKGMLEGAAGHLDGADAHGAETPGGQAGIVAALKLRSAPATVVLSAILVFSWALSMLGMQAAEALLPPAPSIALSIAKVAIFILVPILALFPTSLVVRPLARVFTTQKATTHDALVGKVCTIRTGTVTDRFGEATLEDGGAGVVVRVRIDTGEKLARGDQAVIVGYDADKQEFTVAPLDDELDEQPRRTSAR